jgi:hypothetical protein
MWIDYPGLIVPSEESHFRKCCVREQVGRWIRKKLVLGLEVALAADQLVPEPEPEPELVPEPYEVPDSYLAGGFVEDSAEEYDFEIELPPPPPPVQENLADVADEQRLVAEEAQKEKVKDYRLAAEKAEQDRRAAEEKAEQIRHQLQLKMDEMKANSQVLSEQQDATAAAAERRQSELSQLLERVSSDKEAAQAKQDELRRQFHAEQEEKARQMQKDFANQFAEKQQEFLKEAMEKAEAMFMLREAKKQVAEQLDKPELEKDLSDCIMYIVSSTPEVDLTGRRVMEEIETLCMESGNILFGYDWAGSSNTQPEDKDEARRSRGLDPIDWNNSESVETSQWWVAFQAQVKQNIKIAAQMPSIDCVVVVGIDGGPVSRLEAAQLPLLKDQAQEDLQAKKVMVQIDVRQFDNLDDFIAQLTPEAQVAIKESLKRQRAAADAKQGQDQAESVLGQLKEAIVEAEEAVERTAAAAKQAEEEAAAAAAAKAKEEDWTAPNIQIALEFSNECARKSFGNIDQDGTGSISHAEVNELAQRMEARGHDPKPLLSILKLLDTDGSGEIEFDEWQHLWSRLDSFCSEQVRVSHRENVSLASTFLVLVLSVELTLPVAVYRRK